MSKYVVQGTEAGGYVDNVIPLEIVKLERGELGSRTHVEREIDEMFGHVRDFWQMEPDEVMRAASAYTARCSELYVKLHRVEGRERAWRQVRTQQVVTLLDELDRQYKTASRLLEVRKQDMEQMRSMT